MTPFDKTVPRKYLWLEFTMAVSIFVGNLLLVCISLLLFQTTINKLNIGISMQSIVFLCQILLLPSHYLESIG